MKKLFSIVLMLVFTFSIVACGGTTFYTVTFESNGGTDLDAVEVEENTLLAEPSEPSKTGYDFKGWYTDESLTQAFNFDGDTITESITLYAKWDAVIETFMVLFSTNGGTTVSAQSVNAGSLAIEPTEPTKDGYNFMGWFSDEALTELWDFNTDAVTSHVTLYAKWEAITLTFTVTFDTDGGSSITEQVIEDGGFVTEPTNPTKSGYLFDGWYKEANLLNVWDFDMDDVSEDITLYAKWIDTTPLITFNTNDGTEISSVSGILNEPFDRPTDPTKEGHIFGGWYKDEALSELWDFENDVVDAEMTLYAKWKAETNFNQTFKVLSIGNSFSEDAHTFLWSIAQAYGIDPSQIIIANMYIGGAELLRHTDNIISDAATYQYQLYENQTVQKYSSIPLSAAIDDEAWDVITFQQASHHSGLPSTYADHIIKLTEFVEAHATNPNVQIVWHMTWAYQQTSTHSGFANYNNSQMDMYNAILDAVEQKIQPISQVNYVIPAGTAIQNARTSYVGDLFTRDGYHLSDPLGRYIAGLMFFKSITGFDLNQTITYKPVGLSETQQQLAIEAVNHAYLKPFEVTSSTFTEEPDPTPIEVNGVPYEFDYVQGFWADNATQVSPDTDALYNSFVAVLPIPKYMLPVGSEIVLAEGYQYRVVFLEALGEGYKVVHRTSLYQSPYIVIDEAFWGTYDYIAFNITTNPTSNVSSRLDEVALKLSLYHPEGTGLGHIDTEMTWSSGQWLLNGHEIEDSLFHQSSNPLTPAYFDFDTVFEVETGYQFAYVVLTFENGVYTVQSVSPYQTESLYIDETFALDKELIAFIVTTTNQDVDISSVDLTTVVDMHPMIIPHMDYEMSFISGYWEANKTSITTTNSNMAFLNGFAASNPQSKHYYEHINSITIEAGYQVRVIYLTYDGYGTYTVALRTNNLTGTIVLDEVFWGSYEYIAFNISAVPSMDLSSMLDTLPSKLTYDLDPLTYELGYWNTNGTSLTASTTFAGSHVIPRQFINAGTIITVEAGYQVRLIFLSYSQETGYKVLNRTENYQGTFTITDGFYADYQYIAFNLSTVPSSNLTDVVTTLDTKMTFSMFSEVVVDHVDAPLSFVSGYWNNYAFEVTTGDTTFIKGFAASNVLSKSYFDNISEITIAAGYQVRVIYLDYSYNTYSVLFRTNNLTGTIVLDDLFWANYQFVAFNISSVPSTDLSGVLETLPNYVTFVETT